MPLNIDNHETNTTIRVALWQLGFRPFFLLAGLSAILLMGYWLLVYRSSVPAPYFANPIFWHSHELLFGYAVAVIAGFLLTAVQNWTGRQTLVYLPLILLVLLWFAGRLAIAAGDSLPSWLVMSIDVAFLPSLALAIGIPLWRARQFPNLLIFLSLLAVMTLANVVTHLEHAKITPLNGSGMQLMYFVVMLLIAIMAGRVVPFFTERGVGDIKLKTLPWLDKLAMVSIALYALAGWLQWNSTVSLWLAGVAFVLNTLRWWSWQHPGLWRIPMLWVLHLAYLWLIVSLLLAVFNRFGLVAPVVEVHAFTIGTLGMITLGMMTRVSQGHTGRAIAASRMTSLAFLSLFLAAIIRVLGGIFAGSVYHHSIVVSATLWLLAFALFVIEYIPVLIRPRIDGRPG